MPLKPKQRAFLAAYRKSAMLTAAAEAAQVDRTSHYDWLENPDYAKAFAAARIEAGQVLEDGAIERVTKGVLEPVFYKGKPVGAVRRYPEGLTQFLLAGFFPDKYRSQRREDGPPGGAAPPPLIINTFPDADQSHPPAEQSIQQPGPLPRPGGG